MLSKEISDILRESREDGWVVEPRAKRILSLTGLAVPRFAWARELEEALAFVKERGYPVVAKIVSPRVIHKSDAAGVVTNIDSDEALKETFSRFSGFDGFSGILVEEMVEGVELIIGAKVDYQFGPVVLLGIGGTGVEIYRDIALRMAPLEPRDVEFMVRSLRARSLLEGYRGSRPVNVQDLSRMMVAFSNLAMELEGHITSIDLNPVMCSPEGCIVADARIMLAGDEPADH